MSKFLDLTFSGSAFSGPLRDASGRPVYTLEPINGTLRGLKGVAVSRADGTSVGELTFPSIFSGPGQTNINGQDIPDLLQTSRNGVLLRPEYGFLDGQGNEFCWKNLTCYSRDDKVVATYTRPVTHSFGKNEPAHLSVNDAYASSLDYILFTAVKIEWKRQDMEKAAFTGAKAGASAGIHAGFS